jgi:hypothetical protein
MTMSKKFGMVMVALVLMVGSAGIANAQLCLQLEVPYQLDIGIGIPVLGTPLLVTGIRVGAPPRLPFVGSLTADADGTIRLSWETPLPFGTSGWIAPNVSTVVEFPPTGDATWRSIAHGDGPPTVLNGLVTVLPCPLEAQAADADADPLTR